MDQEMLNALALPLLFSVIAGVYAYTRFPERRPRVLLVLILMQLVGAYAHATQPGMPLFVLLSLYSLVVLGLMLHWFQHPQPEHATERVRKG
ncbi:hypothetical protein E7T06_15595 [Deinococcus sp. Arct2-2]|uniref:hypothetical protein n=1 Tax=Deinococcus sp. Arct2-2 TaxID=2568653 RepID=UPI0010A42CD2|nr:hypothetical protein [Deinococcus sp. Arct2-2]THF68615.1 hypothetical protein E7T06_15595 [Deinococcus sp. Arct2-2]